VRVRCRAALDAGNPLDLHALIALAVARQRFLRPLVILEVGLGQQLVAGAVVVRREQDTLRTDQHRAAFAQPLFLVCLLLILWRHLLFLLLALAAAAPPALLVIPLLGQWQLGDQGIRRQHAFARALALVPGQLDRWHAVAGRELEMRDRPGRIGLRV